MGRLERRIKWAKQYVEALMDEHGLYVYNQVLRLVRDESRAQDLWIQVFVLTLKDKKLFKNRVSLEKYMDHQVQIVFLQEDQQLDPSSLGGIQEDGKELPNTLRRRGSKVIQATSVAELAASALRGPSWTKYAAIVTVLFGAAAVAVGFQHGPVVADLAAFNLHGNTASSDIIGEPLKDLPVGVAADYRLTGANSRLQLFHVAIDNQIVYLPSLQEQVDAWPEIKLNGVPFSKGQTLHLHLYGTIDLLPPTIRPPAVNLANTAATNGLPAEWKISTWNIAVTNQWAIGIVHWEWSGKPSFFITQTYAMYVSSGTSNLVLTLPMQPAANLDTVTVGAGKVVVQSSVSSGTGSPTSILGLPLEVYTLTGTVPLKVFGLPKEVVNPIGFLSHPFVTSRGIYYTTDSASVNAFGQANGYDTWYKLSFSGKVTSLVGPPMDGQPHWIVEGNSLWWVETTPDTQHTTGSVDVLMGPVNGGATTANATRTLSGSVRAFAVTNPYLLWVQSQNGSNQLVVTQAH